MTANEKITLYISTAALIVSIISIIFNYILQKNQSKLAKLQSDNLVKQYSKAICSVEIIQGMRNKYEFKISNVSQVDAKNVDIDFHEGSSQVSIIKNNKHKEKFPVEILSPMQSLSLYTTRDINSPNSYHVSLTWTNPDGSSGSQDTTLIP